VEISVLPNFDFFNTIGTIETFLLSCRYDRNAAELGRSIACRS
jgi:hypothetical protein